MKKIEEQGGYAFPCACASGDKHHIEDGMTLRDWFAGMALQGFLSGDIVSAQKTDIFTLAMYEIADSMLEARKK